MDLLKIENLSSFSIHYEGRKSPFLKQREGRKKNHCNPKIFAKIEMNIKKNLSGQFCFHFCFFKKKTNFSVMVCAIWCLTFLSAQFDH